MAKRRPPLTEQQRQAIRARYPREGARALAAALGVPKYTVKNLVHVEGLRRDAAHSERRPFSAAERQFLAAHYADHGTDQVARQLGRTTYAVYRVAQRMGLKKSAAYLATEASGRMRPGDTRGAASRFTKGQASHNKGRKLSPEQYARMAPTMFRKGHMPHTTKVDGHISLRRDAHGREYLWVRTGLGRWKHLHRHLWEAAHGPVPAGHVVTFKDGDRANCVLANLEMVTSAERMRRTTIMNLPKDLRHAIWALGRLRKTLEKHGEEHDG